jgi:hypothetical protein
MFRAAIEDLHPVEVLVAYIHNRSIFESVNLREAHPWPGSNSKEALWLEVIDLRIIAKVRRSIFRDLALHSAAGLLLRHYCQ